MNRIELFIDNTSQYFEWENNENWGNFYYWNNGKWRFSHKAPVKDVLNEYPEKEIKPGC